jgi:uncharacterized protein YkwD
MRCILRPLLAILAAISLALTLSPALSAAGPLGAHGPRRALSAPNGHGKRHKRHKRHKHHHRRHHRRKRHHRKHHHRRAHKHASASRRGATRASFTCANANLIPDSGNLAAVRSATLCLVNRERVLDGERPLQDNGKLMRAAQGHSEDMVAQDYFSHYGPSGDTPGSRMRAAGYISSPNVGYEIGENIAWGTLQLSTPKAIVEAWMHSQGHRENILDARYRDTGMGVVAAVPRSFGSGQPGAIYTQDFGVIITG